MSKIGCILSTDLPKNIFCFEKSAWFRFWLSKICIGLTEGKDLVTIILRFMRLPLLDKNQILCYNVSRKARDCPDTQPQHPHKRGCISKTISKNFLDKFLDAGMLYGTGIFRGSNKKEPKTLVNTGVSASFIVFYHRAKSVNFWLVDVPWKPFALWARGFESHTLRQ